MNSSEGRYLVHPQGELKIPAIGTVDFPLAGPLVVDTEGGRYHVQWDEDPVDVFTATFGYLNSAPPAVIT